MCVKAKIIRFVMETPQSTVAVGVSNWKENREHRVVTVAQASGRVMNHCRMSVARMKREIL
jgi:hypothetical protein